MTAAYQTQILRFTQQDFDDGDAARQLGVLGQDGWRVAGFSEDLARTNTYLVIVQKRLSAG